MTDLPTIHPLHMTGHSANISWYSPEPIHTQKADSYLYAEVLADAMERVGGKLQTREVPDFHIRVYVYTKGKGSKEVGTMKYVPGERPPNNQLPGDIVTGRIRAWAVMNGGR